MLGLDALLILSEKFQYFTTKYDVKLLGFFEHVYNRLKTLKFVSILVFQAKTFIHLVLFTLKGLLEVCFLCVSVEILYTMFGSPGCGFSFSTVVVAPNFIL